VGFHAQQAAEKYLKAFLVGHQVEFPKTHDIEDLLQRVSRVARPLADALAAVAALTPYAADVRYPGEVPDPTAEQARTALRLAQQVRDAVVPLLEDYLDRASA
jgi:HEPN domain-containing protein